MDSPKPLRVDSLNYASTAGIINYRRFGDIDELAEFLPENVRLTQLEVQPFSCHSRVLCFETIRFDFNHVNCKLHALGDKYPGFLTFNLILHGQGQPVIANNRLVTGDCLFGFDPQREANLVFPGNATRCAVHIRQDVFETCAETLNRLDLITKFLSMDPVYMPQSLSPLRSYLNQLDDLLRQKSPFIHKSYFQQLILQDFLPLLITTLPMQQGPLKSPVKFFRRSCLVKQANDYMQAHIDQPLTLTDLCQALGTSSRALCYGFQEIFGTSPMSYLKILRLQSVHRALKLANPNKKTVTDVASQFGFYHMGHFAHDYKQMFGELPSVTLGRSK